MKLLFKQRMFSWFDSYDIYNESGETVYEVKGQLAWGHCLKIFDANGRELGTIKQRVLTFLPKFEIYIGQSYVGCITKEFSFLRPVFNIDFNGWRVEGNYFEWDYQILNGYGECVATVAKQLFRWTDTYEIDVCDGADPLAALMLVLAIDAEKCSRD